MAAKKCQVAVLVPPATMEHVEEIAGHLETMPREIDLLLPEAPHGNGVQLAQEGLTVARTRRDEPDEDEPDDWDGSDEYDAEHDYDPEDPETYPAGLYDDDGPPTDPVPALQADVFEDAEQCPQLRELPHRRRRPAIIPQRSVGDLDDPRASRNRDLGVRRLDRDVVARGRLVPPDPHAYTSLGCARSSTG